MKNQQLLVLAALTAVLSGCLGPAKIDKWIDTRYSETLNTRPKPKADYLTVTSGLVTAGAKASTTKKQTKNFLPLLFYWQYDYMNTCTLNPDIPVSTFRSTAQAYANSKHLKQKLNGQNIELSVDKIPNTFVLNDRGHIIWLVYAYSWDVITFRPDEQGLVVSYKITKDGAATKTGVVTVSNTDKVRGLRFLQSVKKATSQYLDQYNENIKLMSKAAVDQILTELTATNTTVAK